MANPRPDRVSRGLYLALVASLPLHTVFLRAEIAWKPWLVLLIAVASFDLWRHKALPWSSRAMLGSLVFVAAVLISWPGPAAPSSFWRLLLALGAGIVLMLVTGEHARGIDDVLRVAFWTGAAMGLTALLVAVVSNGVFGEAAVTVVNDLAGVDRVNKPAYLGSGFVAITNWHQDPGYAALWSNVWLALAVFAWTRGAVAVPKWLGASVVGGLIAAVVLTYSRTGWLGLLVTAGAVLFAHRRLGREPMRRAVLAFALGAAASVVFLGMVVATDPIGVGGDVTTALEFRLTYLGVLGPIDLGQEGIIDPDLVVSDNRVAVWQEYGRRLLENPLRGIGLGTGWAEPGLQEPHNVALQLLAEMGIIGLVGFLVLLGSLGRGGGVIAGAVLVIVFVAGLTQTVLFEPVLWFGLGLWLSKSSVREQTASHALATT